MLISKRQKIRIELLKRNISLASIARKVGVSRPCMTQVLDSKIKTYRLRKAIADAIGAEVEDLWPKNGNRNNPRTPFIKGGNPPLTPPKRGIISESERN